MIIPGISVAVFEELIFRGIIFRITEEKLGSYWALAISGCIFGAAHLANPNATLFSSVAIAIEAGLLLGAAYMYTRNLWFPIAIHFAWNFTQSQVYGAATSGLPVDRSLLVTKIDGNTWITGGEFGPEASVQVLAFCLVAFFILLQLSKRRNNIILPYWKRSKTIS